MRVEHLADEARVDVLERPIRARSGGVDENVDPPEAGGDGLHRFVDVLRPGDVGAIRAAVPPAPAIPFTTARAASRRSL